MNSTAPPPSVTVAKTAVTSYTRTYTWEIANSVSPSVVNLFEGQNANVGYTVLVTRSAPVDSGWQVSGVISVTNSGASAIQLNSVSDSISGVGNVTPQCPVTLPTSLGAGVTLVCTYSSALPDGTARTNTATATFNTSSTATGTAAVTFGAPSTIVNGSVNVQDVYNGGAPETIGTAITGNSTIPYTRNVVCGSDLTYVNGVATYPRLNTATIVETNQSANASMTVNCYRPSVGKTVDPDFTRRFTWQILKTVNPSQINLLDGQNTTATYTVTLTKSDPIDENFRVFGNITITNPHPTASLGITGVTDRLGNGLNATVTCPALTVPAGGSLVCTYETNVPTNADGTNTATVTATTGIVYNSPVVPYTFIGLPPSQTTLNSVTVTDTNPATGQPWTFSSSGSQNYQLPFACVDVAYNQNGIFQTTVNNTVVISETGQQSTALVNLTCRIPTSPTGTLTSVCANDVRTFTANVSQDGAYVVRFTMQDNVVTDVTATLTANTPTSIPYSGDATLLSSVVLLNNGTPLDTYEGPFDSCAPPPPPPNASLVPQCTDQGLVWNALTDRTGTYTAQVLNNGQVIDSVTLNLTANTPQQFTFTADSTTPNTIRLVYENAAIVTRTGPESCVSGINAALLRQCVGPNLIWSVQTNTTGDYTAQLVGGETVVENVNLSLVNGVEQEFSFTNDAYSPRFVRLLFQGNQYAVLQGLTEPCEPTSLPETEEPTGRTFANYLYLPNLGR